MKKILSILFIALVGFVACEKENNIREGTVRNMSDKVEIIMSLKAPQVAVLNTKADDALMAHLPHIKDIHVALFGSSHYLQDYALAEPCDANGTTISSFATTNYEGVDDIYYFKVLLPVYEGAAWVHIIANGPESLDYGYENQIMPYLEVGTPATAENPASTPGAYWQCIYLPKGIEGKTKTGNYGFVDYEYLPNTHIVPNPEMITSYFTNIPLIRNFAEVTLVTTSTTSSSLKNVQFALVYSPIKGSVPAMKGADYIMDYQSYDYQENNTTGLIYNGSNSYAGYQVSTDVSDAPKVEADILEWFDPGIVNTDGSISPGDLVWMYERVKTTDRPTCLLVRGNFVEEGVTDADYSYYRMDLMDEKVGGYFPIFRNFRYTVEINMVGNRGDRSIEEAMKRNSGGNMSMSVETENLTDISDGISRLFVEYVHKNVATGDNDGVQYTFWVRYIPDITAVDEDNHVIFANLQNYSDYLTITGPQEVKGFAPAISGTITGPTSIDGTTLVFNYTTVKQSTAADKVSTINIKATNGKEGFDKSTLYRDIEVRVLKKQDMDLKLSPDKVGAAYGQTTVLGIELPSGLAQSMFPLEFRIEDSAKSLNPTGMDGFGHKVSMPVEVGQSIIPDDESSASASYHFIRTVNISEYEAAAETGSKKTFYVELQTLRADCATTIYVTNQYFSKASIDLGTDAVAVSPIRQTVGPNATSATIAVDVIESIDHWTMTAQDSGVTLSVGNGTPATSVTGTGDANVIMHFEANDSDSPRTYTAVLETTGVTSYPAPKTKAADNVRTITVIQGYYSAWSFIETSIPLAASAFNNNTLSSSDDFITIAFGGGASYSGTNQCIRENNGDRAFSMTVTPKTGQALPEYTQNVTITKIVVSYSPNGSKEYYNYTNGVTNTNYTVNAGTGTWSNGETGSTSAVTINFGHTGQSRENQRTSARVASVEVTYSYEAREVKYE